MTVALKTLEYDKGGPGPSSTAFEDSVPTSEIFLLILFSYERYFYIIFITCIIVTEINIKEAKRSTCNNSEKKIWLHEIRELSFQILPSWDWALKIYNTHIETMWQVPHIHARVHGHGTEHYSRLLFKPRNS